MISYLKKEKTTKKPEHFHHRKIKTQGRVCTSRKKMQVKKLITTKNQFFIVSKRRLIFLTVDNLYIRVLNIYRPSFSNIISITNSFFFFSSRSWLTISNSYNISCSMFSIISSSSYSNRKPVFRKLINSKMYFIISSDTTNLTTCSH